MMEQRQRAGGTCYWSGHAETEQHLRGYKLYACAAKHWVHGMHDHDRMTILTKGKQAFLDKIIELYEYNFSLE